MVRVSYNPTTKTVVSGDQKICLTCPDDCDVCDDEGACTPSSICVEVNKLTDCLECASLGEEQNCFLLVAKSGPSLAERINGVKFSLTQDTGNPCLWNALNVFDPEGLVIREYRSGGVSEFNCVDRCIGEFETGVEFPAVNFNVSAQTAIQASQRIIVLTITLETIIGTFTVLFVSSIFPISNCCINCDNSFENIRSCSDEAVAEGGIVTMWSANGCENANAYDPNITYEIGNRRTASGLCFACIKDHGPSPSHPPTTSPTPETNEFWAFLEACL